MSILKRIFPFLSWFEGYDLSALRADFVSGLTVALVLIPQSMAYAQLAGLPPYYGLYAAFLPPIVASLFGSSRQLATGPVAVVSLMTSASLEPLATAGSEQFVAYALLLALMVGVFQLLLGILRLGVVVNFLSHPVVNGFTNAAVLIIATSQLSKIFGVYVDKAPHHYETICRIAVSAWHYLHWPTLGMAGIAFATMIGLRKINKRIPQVLIAVVITTVIAWAVGFEDSTTAGVDAFGSTRVADLVTAFNKGIQIKESLEEQRSQNKPALAELRETDAELCARCHTERELDRAGMDLTADDRGQAATGGQPSKLVLHDLAGLLDRRIDQLKETISAHRGELRALLFVRATTADGVTRFHLRGEAPAGASVEEGTWRLAVKEKQLDPQALKLTRGGAVVGEIPEGLPAFRAPHVDWSVVGDLAAAAIIISLLGFMEAISIAKAMATRTRQKLDPNQELIGQGLANIVGCVGQSYAVSGSFSRSAVNFQSGGKTGISIAFSSLFVMIVLLFLSKGLYHLPQAVLASVIMMAVFGLLNLRGFVHAWRTSRFDGTASILTFVGTLVFAPHLEWGIGIGVVMSLGGYLYRTMRPKVISLAPHPDGMMMDAKRHELRRCKHIEVLSFDGPLNFASANYLERAIMSRVSEVCELQHLVISGNGISEIDASGEETLRSLVDNLLDAGCTVSFSGLSEEVVDVLRRSHFYDHVGKERFFRNRAQTIAAIFPTAHAESDEQDCPYRLIMPPLVELSLHPDGSLRSVQRHQLRSCRHIAVLRFDGPLNFANAAYMEQEILASLVDRPALRYVVLVAHSINAIDESGAEKLGELVTRLRNDGYAVSFSGLKEEVVEVLSRTHVLDVLGPENLFPTQIVALASIYARAHTGSSEEDCPLVRLSHRLTELSLHSSGLLREASKRKLRLCPHIAVLRFDGPLPLANSKACQSEFIRWATTRSEVETVVFVCNAIDRLDAPDAANLAALVTAVREAGFRVALSGFPDRTLETLIKSGAAASIGMDSIYPSAPIAVTDLFADAHRGGDEEDCPLAGLLPKLVEVSRHSDGQYRDARRNGLALCQRIVAVRYDGPLSGATFRFFETRLREVLAGRKSARYLIFAAHALSAMDEAAAGKLLRLFADLAQQGYWIGVSGLKDDDYESLQRANRDVVIRGIEFFPTQGAAVGQVHEAAHRGCDEGSCPLLKTVEAPPG